MGFRLFDESLSLYLALRKATTTVVSHDLQAWAGALGASRCNHASITLEALLDELLWYQTKQDAILIGIITDIVGSGEGLRSRWLWITEYFGEKVVAGGLRSNSVVILLGKRAEIPMVEIIQQSNGHNVIY